MVGVAVNVTLVPEQIVLPGFAAILTDGITVDVTVIVIEFDVTGFGLAQPMDEVISTVIIFPFVNELFW